MSAEVVHHHDLCFGCGRTNLFGLLLEVEAAGPGRLAGRCFIKQDHQGAEPGFAHEGLLATALIEAMMLAGGPDARLERFEVTIEGRAPVGEFVELEARGAEATATVEGRRVAIARGTLIQKSE